jgi:hypothetical protein
MPARNRWPCLKAGDRSSAPHWRKSCLASKSKSSSVLIRPKDSPSCPNAGS